MTIEEAEVALACAPDDNKMSRVEPNVTRAQLLALTKASLRKLPKHIIDVSPVMARHIEAVAQDNPWPATMRFIRDPIAGRLVAGWNRGEERNRQQEGIYGTCISQLDGYNTAVLEHQRQIAADIQRRLSEQALQAMLGPQPAYPTWHLMQGSSQHLQQQQPPTPPPAGPPPSSPTPKPNPKDPTFVLKRPKLG
jgi:hypothetical protein